MKQISNADFKQAVLLLSHFARTSSTAPKDREMSRRAGLLVRKWSRNILPGLRE